MRNEMTYEKYLEFVRTSCAASKDAPVYRALASLHGKWRLPVVYELSKREGCSFGTLKCALPNINNTMLLTTLKDLEKMGMVSCDRSEEIAKYALTEKGKAFCPIFYEIAKWAEAYL